MTQQEFTNRYQFSIKTDKIGGGSFGTVYKAYDTVLDKEVAIKVSEVKYVGDKEFSLLEEFKAIENVPANKYIANYDEVFRYESFNGIYDYGLMQYYSLGNLSNYLKNNTVSQDKRESLVVGILEGIAFLHQHKVVHRDLKPSNILVVDRRGELIPKITDFGLSKQASADTKGSRFTNSFAGGTLQYSSPEQLKGFPLKLNTDLWSFGVIAYEILTGDTLFEADSQGTASAEWQNAITQKILHEDVTQQLATLPTNWQHTIKACLERDLTKRAQNTDALFVLLNGERSPKEEKEIPPIPPNDDETIIKEKPASKTAAPSAKSKPESSETTPGEKKIRIPYMLITIIIIAGLWYLKPWEKSIDEIEKIDPVVLEESHKLKNAADSAYYAGAYELSLQHYNAAFKLLDDIEHVKADKWLEKHGVMDSINSLTALINNAEENNWLQVVKLNEIEPYKEYISKYPEGKYVQDANDRIGTIRNKMIKEAVKPKPKNTLTAMASIVKKLEEGRGKDMRVELQEFYRLQADLTLHKLAYSLYRYQSEGVEYKFEEQILVIANNLDNTNQDFISERDQFKNNPKSRYHLAKLMPFLKDALNDQINESNQFLKNSYYINSTDIKLLSTLGSAERVSSTGKHESRYISSHNSIRSIFNFTIMINEALNYPKPKGEIINFIAYRIQDINAEIVNLLDNSKIKNEAPIFYKNNRSKNGSTVYIKNGFTWMLMESGKQAEGFYSYRYLRYGEIKLIFDQTAPLVKVKK